MRQVHGVGVVHCKELIEVIEYVKDFCQNTTPTFVRKSGIVQVVFNSRTKRFDSVFFSLNDAEEILSVVVLMERTSI